MPSVCAEADADDVWHLRRGVDDELAGALVPMRQHRLTFERHIAWRASVISFLTTISAPFAFASKPLSKASVRKILSGIPHGSDLRLGAGLMASTSGLSSSISGSIFSMRILGLRARRRDHHRTASPTKRTFPVASGGCSESCSRGGSSRRSPG